MWGIKLTYGSKWQNKSRASGIRWPLHLCFFKLGETIPIKFSVPSIDDWEWGGFAAWGFIFTMPRTYVAFRLASYSPRKLW